MIRTMKRILGNFSCGFGTDLHLLRSLDECPWNLRQVSGIMIKGGREMSHSFLNKSRKETDPS